MHTSPWFTLGRLIASEAVVVAVEKGLDIIDIRLESLIKGMKDKGEKDDTSKDSRKGLQVPERT